MQRCWHKYLMINVLLYIHEVSVLVHVYNVQCIQHALVSIRINLFKSMQSWLSIGVCFSMCWTPIPAGPVLLSMVVGALGAPPEVHHFQHVQFHLDRTASEGQLFKLWPACRLVTTPDEAEDGCLQTAGVTGVSGEALWCGGAEGRAHIPGGCQSWLSGCWGRFFPSLTFQRHHRGRQGMDETYINGFISLASLCHLYNCDMRYFVTL